MPRIHEPWKTLAEVADYLAVSEITIKRWLKDEYIPAHRVGHGWRFRLSEIDAWIVSGHAAPKAAKR